MKPFALSLLLAAAACGPPRVEGIATIEEQDAPLLSAVRAGDPDVEPQFALGFYSAERDGWRWTRGRFSIVLLAPPDAAKQGAVVELTFAVPQVVLDRLGPVTVSAAVGGVALSPETRDTPALRAYRRAAPPQAFSKREVLVEFALNKVLKPFTYPGEDRELGVAVHGAALLPAGGSGAAK
jgi:hypothetical protein